MKRHLVPSPSIERIALVSRRASWVLSVTLSFATLTRVASAAPDTPPPPNVVPAAPGAEDLLKRLRDRVAQPGGLTSERVARRAVQTSPEDRSRAADVDSVAAEVTRSNVGYYPLISPNRLTVNAAASAGNANVFVVTVSYDDSNSFIYMLPQLVPAPPSSIVKSAAIPRGGY